MIAYKLTRPDLGGWVFAGTTPAEVAKAVENEIATNEGMDPDDCAIVLEAYETTQEEIDALEEFQGW